MGQANMPRYSFHDAVTGVLKAHGFVEANAPGDVRQEVLDNFDLEPGRWRWDGAAWVAFVPPPPPPSELALALDDALADVTPAGPKLKAVLAALRKVTR